MVGVRSAQQMRRRMFQLGAHNQEMGLVPSSDYALMIYASSAKNLLVQTPEI